MIMSEQTKPGEPVEAPATSAAEQVPDWLGNRLKRMFTEVMDEPVPDEFKALLDKLDAKEKGRPSRASRGALCCPNWPQM